MVDTHANVESEAEAGVKSQSSQPALRFQDSQPTLRVQDSQPTLRAHDSQPTLREQDSRFPLRAQDSQFTLRAQDSQPTLRAQDSHVDTYDGQGDARGSGETEGTAVDEAAAPGQKPRSKLQITMIMTALGMAVFLAALDITIITTALPTISGHFHSPSGYVWIGSAYLLACAASTPVWGKVSDVFGRKPILLLANLIFFIGSLIAGLANSIGMLIAARALQGAGGGGLLTLVNIVISDLFSMRTRGAFFGIIGGVWAVASAVGPLIGGAFTEKVTWRWCFYINLPLDGLAFFIILIFLDLKTPLTPFWDGMKSLDWLGALTIIGGTLMFLFGLEYGGVTFPWDSATVICLLVFGVFTWALFFLIEWKIAEFPVMPLRLFKYRSNLASLGVCFTQSFVFIAGSYYLPLYFQAVLGATPILSGVYSIVLAISLSLTSAATGVFIRKTGRYRPPIWFGMFVLTLGFGLLIDLDSTANWPKIIIYQIIAGIGIGPNFQAPLIALQTRVAPADIATATATFGFMRQLASGMSVVIGQVVFQNQMAKKGPQLSAQLGPQVAAELGAGNAGANVGVVDSLPPAQRQIARQAFTESLQDMWIMYTAFAAFGLLLSLMIGKQQLSQEKQENKIGLEAQRAAAKERQLEAETKKHHDDVADGTNAEKRV
ncbi:hypothetical protein EV356DRAFT_484368 [Viridothelium virens]|uniref:Efflux pump dotC n=1 Tax=Viridothelium virens TaxID=1048519 RepID=A0A6A6HB36_VIRVR|nr:hypothetical protein EV356DRAFT_484368 [Viridothelium virens]